MVSTCICSGMAQLRQLGLSNARPSSAHTVNSKAQFQELEIGLLDCHHHGPLNLCGPWILVPSPFFNSCSPLGVPVHHQAALRTSALQYSCVYRNQMIIKNGIPHPRISFEKFNLVLLWWIWPALWLRHIMRIWSVMIVQDLSLVLFPDFANIHNPYVQVAEMYWLNGL